MHGVVTVVPLATTARCCRVARQVAQTHTHPSCDVWVFRFFQTFSSTVTNCPHFCIAAARPSRDPRQPKVYNHHFTQVLFVGGLTHTADHTKFAVKLRAFTPLMNAAIVVTLSRKSLSQIDSTAGRASRPR